MPSTASFETSVSVLLDLVVLRPRSSVAPIAITVLLVHHALRKVLSRLANAWSPLGVVLHPTRNVGRAFPSCSRPGPLELRIVFGGRGPLYIAVLTDSLYCVDQVQ